MNFHAVGFTADPKLKEYIEKKFSKLDKYHHKVLTADIYLKLENTGQIKDKIVEAKLQVPGSIIFAEDNHKTFEAAIDKLVETLKRQLKKQNDLLRGR